VVKNILNKAYKFRLYPNKDQQELFSKTFGCVRFIYNKMLSDKIIYYEKTKQKLNSTPAQYKSEFEWLKEVDSLALANAQMNLQTAYNNFFRSPMVGFPKFKSKHKNKNSYTTNNQGGNIRIENKKIKLPKLGFVNIKLHRKIPDNQIIKSCTISKTPSDKYYISVLVEYEQEIPQIVVNQNNIIGLDMDMKNLYTDSNGTRAEYPRYYRQMLDKIKKEQKKLSKRKIGSNNRTKQKLKVAKLHEKVANQRKNFLHKLSRQIANAYEGICIETLDMKAISQHLHLGKSVYDNGWGMFTTFLKYKLTEQGKSLIKIDKWFPSSKICNLCGYINNKLTLLDREWVCSCGNIIDRDLNAAMNIRDEGIKILLSKVS
jgi:putative transposase